MRWVRQANASLLLKGDPSFVQLHDKCFDPDKGSLALIFELLVGGSLEAYIRDRELHFIPEEFIW
jgi:hypothetical protein